MDQLDLDALWRSYFRGRLTGHSAVGGTLALRGPLRHPSQWTLDGTLTALSLDVENVNLHNQDPVRFSLARESINIEQLHLLGQGTDFTAHGSVLFPDPAPSISQPTAASTSNCSPASTPDFTSSGLVSMKWPLAARSTSLCRTAASRRERRILLCRLAQRPERTQRLAYSFSRDRF